ncbi:MAG: hypothetical protein QF472_06680 [Candidatus Marinimicrobia bacterium]|jgi:regulator of sigma D|nr:hypothetical protein [Candidatus Neomarinimicrobiota bacterium]MDP6853620.1 hypothetical protein [Candidatus Neomarinimicrobiota bacterium]
MSTINIQEALDNLGQQVSKIAEENRVFKLHEESLQKFVQNLGDYISPEDWGMIYNTIDDIFIKEVMKDWGSNLFPKDFKF